MVRKRIYFRHGSVRKYQDEMLKDVTNCMEEGKHLIAHAPVGIGKTDSVLSPAVSHALEEDATIFFLTPKISQHMIAVDVLKGLVRKYELNLRGVDLVGKRYMCIDPVLRKAESEVFYELCNKKRKDEACEYFANIRGFSKKQKARADLTFREILSKYGEVGSNQELKEMCESSQLCPYEASVRIASESQIIICDYYHLFSPLISQLFLKRTGKKLDNSVLIIDEGHNLPDRLRRNLTTSVNTFLVDRASKECSLVGVKELSKKVRKLGKAIEKIARRLGEDDKETLVVKEELNQHFDFEEDLIDDLYATGITYLESTNRTKSACLKIRRFLEQWNEESESFLRILKKWGTGKGFTLTKKCLDPSLCSKDVIDQSHSTIMMSGTMMPTEMYRDLLGFDESRTLMRTYSSPFEKKNRLNIICRSVSTRYKKRTDSEFEKISLLASKVINSTPGNTAVYFPSYHVLKSCFFWLEKYADKPLLIQKAQSKPGEIAELLSRFRAASLKGGAVLVGVQGGSVSEGIDLPGEELLGAVIVGVPLAHMTLETRGLIDYYDSKFGRGWEYGYIYPAISRALQAAGRVIRNETDRGVVVFLDERYLWRNYTRNFPKDLDVVICDNPEKYVKEFWRRA